MKYEIDLEEELRLDGIHEKSRRISKEKFQRIIKNYPENFNKSHKTFKRNSRKK